MLPDSTGFGLARTFLHSLTDLSFVLGRGGAVSSSVITFAFGFGFHFAALVFLLFRTTEVNAVHNRIANLFVICHKEVAFEWMEWICGICRGKSMVEQADAGECHCDAVFVARVNHVVIAD